MPEARLPGPSSPGVPMDDVQRMLAVKAGDMAAFDALVTAYQRPLTAFFDRLMNHPALAEEFAQEVFCRIYQYREDYEPRAAFATYLYRIARNLWIDHLRHRASGPRMVSMETAGCEGDGETLGAGLPARVPAPSAALESEERARTVRSAVAALPEKLRLVFVMGEGQGLSYVQISEVLEIPVGTVKSRMHAAVLHLRESLAPLVAE